MFELVEALRVSSNNGHDFVLCFSKWDWVFQPSLDCPWSWQSENQFPHVLHYFPSLTEFFKENKNGAGNCATIIYSAIQDFRSSQSIRNRNFFFLKCIFYTIYSSVVYSITESMVITQINSRKARTWKVISLLN